MHSRNGLPSMIIGPTHTLVPEASFRPKMTLLLLLPHIDWLESMCGFKSNCHSKFSGGKENVRSPDQAYSNPLIKLNYYTVDQLALKYSVKYRPHWA